MSRFTRVTGLALLAGIPSGACIALMFGASFGTAVLAMTAVAAICMASEK